MKEMLAERPTARIPVAASPSLDPQTPSVQLEQDFTRCLALCKPKHVEVANLFGLPRAMTEAHWPSGERDIDCLFVGNFHPAIQRDRLPFLARLAGLGRRWKVVMR